MEGDEDAEKVDTLLDAAIQSAKATNAEVADDLPSAAPLPGAEDQAKLDDLLDLASVGVTLTEEFQLDPEQSTSAIIVPHPEAKYFIA